MSPAADGPAVDIHAGAAVEHPAVESPGVEQLAKGWLVTDAPLARVIPVALRYDPVAAPSTVRFVFPGGVEWAFPRDLLESGLRAPARHGPVGVWPCGRVQVVVEFHTQDSVSVVQFNASALVRFLTRTYAATASVTRTR